MSGSGDREPRSGAAERHLDEQAVLRAVVEGTSTDTGEEFFRALVRNLATALEVHGAWVTEYLAEQNRLRSRAFWLDGHFVTHFEYDVANTPCEPVVRESRLLHIPERVIELYPKDPDLPELQAVSYLGVPLSDAGGAVMGHLAVLDNRPMPPQPLLLDTLQVFASRAVAELRRLRAEDDVRESNEKLERLFDSAMDAIVELDEEGRITRFNRAAEILFGGERESLRQTAFATLLTAPGRETLAAAIHRLAAAGGPPYLWIAGGLSACTLAGAPLAIEATLSAFELGRRRFHVLVLRDVEERLSAERQIEQLRERTAYLSAEIASLRSAPRMIGSSPALAAVLREVEQVCETDATVLVLGETGTGKELIARAIHEGSRRRDKPLIKVNCAAMPASLIESELFGHEKGAFTGATERRLGRFTLADGGTLFLDEIGELPIDLQSKLLRVLQEGELEPVGSSETRRVDVRVVAATNRDLAAEVAAGRFREDLYYRLAVYPISLPPLRARGDDVLELAAAFAQRLAREMGKRIEPFDAALRQRLLAHAWPGNVRELQNVVERAVIGTRTGRLDLDPSLPPASTARVAAADAEPSAILTAGELRDLERRNIERALELADWKVAGPAGAALRLGMNQSTLSSRMKALGIRRPTR